MVPINVSPSNIFKIILFFPKIFHNIPDIFGHYRHEWVKEDCTILSQ